MTEFYTNVCVLRNKIYTRGFLDGERYIHKEPFSPSYFIPTEKDSPYKTIEGKNLEKLEFDSIRKSKDFLKKHDDIVNYDLYGTTNLVTQYLSEKYPEDIEWDFSLLSIFNIDIEVEFKDGFPEPKEANNKITAITLKDRLNNRYISLGYGDFKNHDKDKKVIYKKCKNEVELLESFLKFWEKHPPDVITGWNCLMFDIPYLINRISKILGEDESRKISPYNCIFERSNYSFGKVQQYYDICGIEILDYMTLYKKFTYKVRESYSLDFIGYVELGMRKLTNDEKISGLHLCEEDHQSFIEYNIRDIEIVECLDEKHKLLNLAITIAYQAKENFESVFSPVKTWDNLIYNYLKLKNIIVPFPKEHEKSSYPGAYVMEPKPGMYEWVVSFDVTSLYPSLIRTFNIGPDTIQPYKADLNIDDLLNGVIPEYENNDGLTASGYFYNNNKKGFMAELVHFIFEKRKTAKSSIKELKKEYSKTKNEELKNKLSSLDAIQMGIKILLNSLYGAMGNKYFRFYSLENAKAITLTGQLVLKWVTQDINKFFNDYFKTDKNYVVYGDTDSLFIEMKDVVEKKCSNKEKSEVIDYLIGFCDKIVSKVIKQSIEKFCKEFNAFENCLSMEREVLSDKCIWTAKKRYMANCLDTEGVRHETPQLKIMGIESVRSSTPELVREKINDSIRIILNEDEKSLHKFISKFKKEYFSLNPEDISSNSSVEGVDKYYSEKTLYKKATPIHVRGSLIYNKLIKEYGLEEKYKLINNGEKIKYVYLKLPNKIKENTISFSDHLPEEFNLNEYIDYEHQFNKTFLEPLKKILDCIGWKDEKKPSIDILFS